MERRGDRQRCHGQRQRGRYPGWFSVQLELLQGKPRKRPRIWCLPVETVWRRNRSDRRNCSVPPAHHRRVRVGREGVHSLADSIARGVTTNDLDYLKNLLAARECRHAGTDSGCPPKNTSIRRRGSWSGRCRAKAKRAPAAKGKAAPSRVRALRPAAGHSTCKTPSASCCPTA